MAKNRDRRQFMKSLGLGAGTLLLGGCAQKMNPKGSDIKNRLPDPAKAHATSKKPNFVVIFCDDMGYGDLGCYGHPTIRTPNLDRMAAEGQKWTNFYAGASVCTPSRASLLTGRLPIRNGMCSDERRVLSPESASGLPQDEVTIAEALKEEGYKTACVGKWHLGHLPPHLPTNNGFDSYFGIPYSNDMDWVGGDYRQTLLEPKIEYFNVPLMRNEQIVERPADQRTITKRYTEEGVRFIKNNKDKPFFLYLANSLPHVPLFASEYFRNKSLRGLYGDVIEEIDWGVGQILETLESEGLAKNTLVIFTSDNGPWLIFDEHGGSAGLLREGKGATFEGGMREPGIMWWPGAIEPGVVNGLGATMDVFTTVLTLAGATVPNDRIVDGLDLSPVLFGSGPSPRETMFYYRGEKLYAARMGSFKAHFFTKPAYTRGEEIKHDPPLLYHLGHDPSEKFDIAKDHPEVIKQIQDEVARHNSNLVRGEDQLVKMGQHLFILSGQSNMEGLDPELTFTPTVQNALGKGRVIVVKDALSGMPIRRWYKGWTPSPGEGPEEIGDLYDQLMARVKAAIGDRHIQSVTFVWMQGERDAREWLGDKYEDSFLGVLAQLREDFKRRDINFVVGRLSDFSQDETTDAHWSRVRRAQVKVAQASPWGEWVDTDDLNDGRDSAGKRIKNDLHYSVKGYETLGRRFASKAIELVRKNRFGPALSPGK